jgi:hypothetical protein
MRLPAFAILFAACMAPRAAWAGDPATAEALFDQARKLMEEGAFPRACPLLEESQRLDPGVGTQFNLANCYEHEGKTASAWAIFLEVAAETKAAGQEAREEAARDRAAALAPKLARLTITVPENHPSGLEVKRDGAVVRSVLWGVPVPVDPGPHRVEVTAPGWKTWRSKLVIGPEPTTTALAVPELERGVAESPAVSPVAVESDRPAPHHEGGSSPWGTRKVVAAGLVGVGVVGVLVGSGFGIDAIVKHSDSESGCPTNTTCTAAAGAVRDEAIHSGNVSTAGFVIGLLAAGGGVILWWTTPTSSTEGSVHAALGPRSALLSGTF